jgi:ribosomal RNA assembly protein
MADTEYMYELKIPKDRIAVLIGTGGDVKKQIEDATKTHLDVKSEEGDVFIRGEDSIMLYSAREIIKAIGRGFNPEIAMMLLKQEYSLEMINLREMVDEQHMMRLKGRVIGADGKARKNIEFLTETYISIYGKTIGIIGESANVAVARKAVETLLSGSNHATVYKWLEKNRRELKRRELVGDKEFEGQIKEAKEEKKAVSKGDKKDE